MVGLEFSFTESMTALTKNTAVLIVDGYYAFKGAKTCGSGTQICARKLADYVNQELLAPEGVSLLDKFWMDSTPEPTGPKNQSRVRALENLGYQCPEYRYKICSREVACPMDGRRFRVDFTVQAGVDVGIAVLAAKRVAFAPEPVTDAVLIAGDGDFVPAIQLMRDAGKRVWLLSFRSSFSTKLRALVGTTRFVFLDDMIEHLAMTRVSDTARNRVPKPFPFKTLSDQWTPESASPRQILRPEREAQTLRNDHWHRPVCDGAPGVSKIPRKGPSQDPKT
jgi:hypothetical protein